MSITMARRRIRMNIVMSIPTNMTTITIMIIRMITITAITTGK